MMMARLQLSSGVRWNTTVSQSVSIMRQLAKLAIGLATVVAASHAQPAAPALRVGRTECVPEDEFARLVRRWLSLPADSVERTKRRAGALNGVPTLPADQIHTVVDARVCRGVASALAAAAGPGAVRANPILQFGPSRYVTWGDIQQMDAACPRGARCAETMTYYVLDQDLKLLSVIPTIQVGGMHRPPNVALQLTSDTEVRGRALRALAAYNDGSLAAELWR